tara:strand:+ start:222 stop:1475 length:1254 start_codon:yes stop_codon:yes gene_type:complete
MRLTKKDIEKANKRRKYADERGLFLSVSANGRKSWAFCYRFPDPNGRNGYREREMGLGSIDDVSLDEARDRAVELRRIVRDGIDPLEDRQRTKREVIRKNRDGSTFKQVAERFIETKKAEWDEGGKSEQSWRGSLGKHVFPVIGDMRIDRIDRADIIELLRPIWKPKGEGGNPVTAGRILPRLDMIFEEAIESGLRPLPNPADRASIRKSLPNLKKVHSPKKQKSMPYAQVPEFMGELRKREGIASKALEFLILTGLRTKEVIGAVWDEIDFENAMWTIPAKRMKISRKGSGEAREDHRVPLSKAALDLLRALPREEDNPHIFISVSKPGKGLSNMAMLKLLKEDMGYAGEAVVHGFRSSFRTWVAEQTDYPGELAEVAIAHYPSDETVSAYLRTDYYDRRAPMMDDWAAYVTGEEK